MSNRFQISFHQLEHSEKSEAYARERAERLERFFDRITACKVAIEPSHGHNGHAVLHVRVELIVPGDIIVVKRSAAGDDESLRALLTTVFDVAERQLEEYARIRRGEVKRHA